MNDQPPALERPVALVGAHGMRLGIETRAPHVTDKAVLMLPVPGGTRAGPHRMHVRLARELSHAGLPSLRFDPPGGGDSRPDAYASAAFDDDVVTAARHLLALYPDAFVAVLAVGSAAASAARAWYALAGAQLPLSALCLIDPKIALTADRPRLGWWRRAFGRGGRSVPLMPAKPHGSDGTGGFYEQQAWYALAQAVRAARAKLLVATRDDEASQPALQELARGNRYWRKALRRSRDQLEVDGADPSFTGGSQWRELVGWAAARLAE